MIIRSHALTLPTVHQACWDCDLHQWKITLLPTHPYLAIEKTPFRM